MVKIFFVLVTLSVIGLLFMPESPYWLLVFKRDKSECAKSLQWIYPDSTVCYFNLLVGNIN